MSKLTDLTAIHNLEDRYPFNEAELEILVRCHDHVSNEDDKSDFIMKLALASPYSYFFLPGDAMADRVLWIEDNILPAGFANELRAATSTDAFVEYANQGEERSLERFIEGVADTGRRGTKEALRVLYRLVDDPRPEELADFCIRLAVASDTLVAPNLIKPAALQKLEALQPTADALAGSLRDFCQDKPLDSKMFMLWAEEKFPMLSSPLSTFIQNLLFHGHDIPRSLVPYQFPHLEHASDIFPLLYSPELGSLSFTSTQFGGKVSSSVQLTFFVQKFAIFLKMHSLLEHDSGIACTRLFSTDDPSIAWNGLY